MKKCRFKDKLEPLIDNFNKHLTKTGIRCKQNLDEGEYWIRIDIYKQTVLIGIADVFYSPKKKSFTISPKGNISTENKTLIINEFDIFLNKRSVNQVKYLNIGIEIDVDGSYKDGFSGFGFIIRNNGKFIHSNYGQADPSSNQINGELQAVIEALKWCEIQGHHYVTIYHDLIHSQKYANGEYKPNTDFTKE